MPRDVIAGEDIFSILSISLRIESQDAWVFVTPVPDSVIKESSFAMGSPACDNVIANIFDAAGYNVINSCLTLKAIEMDSRHRQNSFYSFGGANVGRETKSVLISNPFMF